MGDPVRVEQVCDALEEAHRPVAAVHRLGVRPRCRC
jgi:hypothetical protein